MSSWRLHAGGETARLAMSLAIWRGEEETRRRKEEHKLKLNLKTLTCQVGKDGTNMDLWIAEKCWIVGTLVSNPHRITCLYIADESNRYWKDEFVKKHAEVVDQSHRSTNRWFQIVDSTPRHFRIAMSSANFRQACCTNRTGSCQGSSSFKDGTAIGEVCVTEGRANQLIERWLRLWVSDYPRFSLTIYLSDYLSILVVSLQFPINLR